MTTRREFLRLLAVTPIVVAAAPLLPIVAAAPGMLTAEQSKAFIEFVTAESVIATSAVISPIRH